MVFFKEMGSWLIVMLSSLLLYLFGAWDIAIQVMVVAMVVDYLSGVMAAKSEKNWSSKVGIKGIYKKVGMLLCIIVANMVDKVTGSEIIRTAIILFLIGNEGISILENLGRLGVPIAPKLLEVLSQLRGKGDTENENTN